MKNPLCSHCGGQTHKRGRNKSGTARYRCSDCNRSYTPKPVQSMYKSNAEKQKAYRDRQRLSGRQAAGNA